MLGLWRWGGSFGPHKNASGAYRYPLTLHVGWLIRVGREALEATTNSWSHKYKPACILQVPLAFGYIWAKDFTELVAKDTLVAQT